MQHFDEFGDLEVRMSFELSGYGRHLALSSDDKYLYISNDTDGVQIVGFEK